MHLKSTLSSRELFWLPLVLIHLLLLANTKFTLWPEMVVYPYLINNNFILYKDIINPYPPMLTLLLSVFGKIFGYLPVPYEILSRAVVVLIDISIFTLARKIAKNY